jgi:hypothetical protein
MKTKALKVLVFCELERFGVKKQQVLEEHSLSCVVTLKQALMQLIPSGDVYDLYKYQVANEVEKIILLYGALREQSSWTGVISTVMLYIKTHYNESLMLVLKEILNQYYESSDEAKFQAKSQQADELLADVFDDDNSECCLEEHAGEWVNLFKMAQSNWVMATQNEGFRHVSRVLSLLIGAGMVQATSLNCEVAGLKLFSELCVPKFVSAFDIIDAMMTCVVFFVEGGYECIQAGSLTPLMYGERDFQHFDDLFLECKKVFDYAKPGNYHMLGADIDENAVIKQLNDAIEEGKRLAQLTKNALSKKLIMDRLGKLQEMESDLQQHRMAASIRVKPYCVAAVGGTAVGKSTITPLIMHNILVANGFDASDDKIISLKAGRKHQESYRTYFNGIIFDDFVNTKPDFIDESPCEDLLEVVNTAVARARMAELSLKDRVLMLPKGVVVSSNVKDLNATVFSEEPASITRRVDTFITFEVKEEFATNSMLDPEKVSKHFDGNVPLVPDLWHVTLEKSYPMDNPTEGRAATIGFKTIKWNGKLLEKVDFQTALQYLVVDSRAHFALQNKMIDGYQNLHEKLTICEKCESPTCVCDLSHDVSFVEHGPCARSKMMSTRSQKRQGNAKSATNNRGRGAKSIPKKHLEEHAFQDHVDGYIEAWQNLSRFSVSILVPTQFSRSYASLSVLRLCMMYPRLKFLLLLPFSGLYFVNNGLLSLTMIMLYLYLLYVIFVSYVRIMEMHLANQRQAAWHHAKHIATRTAIILAAGVVVKLLYDMAQQHFFRKKVTDLAAPLSEHGFMHPSDEEIQERDENDVTADIAVEHNWATVHVDPLPVTEKAKTTVEDDLVAMCEKNTAVIVDKERVLTHIFFVTSNVAIIPSHLIKTWHNKLCYIVRRDVTTTGSNFPCYLSYSHSAQIPDTDLSLISVPSGGPSKNLLPYFPLEPVKRDFGVRICLRDLVGNPYYFRSYGRYSTQQLKSCRSTGYAYCCDSFVGMCGAPVISQTVTPMIVGTHVAGLTEKKFGFAPALYQSDIESAMEELQRCASILLPHSEGTLPPELYGKTVLAEQAIHSKSCVRRLDMDEGVPNMKVYGSCPGRATYYSKVVPSLISPVVTEVCDVPQKWGKPKFGKGDVWLESLKYSSRPSVGVEPTLLDWAVEDYTKPLLSLIEERPKLRSEIQPLTNMQVVCGIDGRKFIDKMVPSTSVGFPLSGPKSNFLTELDPEDYEDFAFPQELDQMFWDEFDVACAAWKNRVRYHPVFKACLKDEPTPLVKDKVRVFQAAPIVLQLAVRKYFLPIARFMSLFPDLTECAVGLNTMGPDWEEFQAHIAKFGKDRILAGDYSKYDLRMPAQLTMAAFKVMIEIARFCGYGEDDLVIMQGIATDVCYPVIAFNGDLLQFVGSNPSGQNLTVYLNSIVNSLLFRCGFLYIVCKPEVPFRKAVALGTYGDDAKSSVKRGFDEFNHISYAQFLADRDMKFTMPDKTSTPTPFMNDEDADFLKRKNMYIPELNRHVGALDEESIFKSLHANLKSKSLTREELAATCIDGALREWFFHGRELYEFRREQMRQVAVKSEIDHQCVMLDQSFDDQVGKWFERYFPKE